ncbi:hypothetical protein [Mucilaginibacter terrae]|uniref:Uncharacterized protein n=1 Tax=Mucilaginibacter terrae TaxID=1955052 RepID=A0ABU3GY47_9SPHI|nr:hypothetical protein [Mucilaginibacter terrae]MDT3404701.1 hypothetical protein [Mucilaginibacter terrae]
MNLDHYEPFSPLQGVPINIYLYSIKHEANVLTIVMATYPNDGNRYIQVSFRGCFTYRYTLESGRMKFLSEETWTNPFNVSSNSKYLNWFKEEGYGIFDDYDLKHYLLVCDDLIDVISATEPKVEWIPEPTA